MTMASQNDGYYDEDGYWRRTKFCFTPCGARCTCKPPLGKYYDETKVVRRPLRLERKRRGESEWHRVIGSSILQRLIGEPGMAALARGETVTLWNGASYRKEKCPDALLPDGPKCPRCGGRRGPSGVDGGSWVHY